jgi:hypothetical protein
MRQLFALAITYLHQHRGTEGQERQPVIGRADFYPSSFVPPPKGSASACHCQALTRHRTLPAPTGGGDMNPFDQGQKQRALYVCQLSIFDRHGHGNTRSQVQVALNDAPT